MGYREEGMFGFTDAAISDKGTTNPKFTYPSRSIRFLEGQANLDKKSQGYKLHRGYMRNLDQPALGAEFPVSKCNFQFNPQEIRQSVSMRSDIYSAILQDPAQLSQPIGAETTFGFDLLFDRSLEVASGVSKENDRYRSSYDITADINSPAMADVYDIGVLADLRVFYAVIGQGFSKEMLQFQIASLKNSYKYAVDTQTGASAGSTDTAEVIFDDSKIEDMIAANYGNAAFLMPNPVRVMFSSLFMVDGFVTATNVDFLKFNTNMVPLQCRVTISMSAMYIGFAKQETFLTKVLTDAAAAKSAEEAESSAAKQELQSALVATASRFGIAAAVDYSTNWDEAISGGTLGATDPAWAYITEKDLYFGGASPFRQRTVYVGFPSVKPNKGSETRYENGEEITTGADRDSILKLFQSSAAISLAYTWTINVYGSGRSAATGLTEAQADKAITDNTYSSGGGNGVTIQQMGLFTVTETATNEDEWGKGSSGDGEKAERVRRRTYKAGSSGLSNSAGYSYQGASNYAADYPDYIKEAYYIVEISVTISPTATTPLEAKTVSKVFSIKGTDSIGAHILSFKWGSGINSDLPDNFPKGVL